MKLTTGQEQAVELVKKTQDEGGVAIIAGAAGTGKTTVIRQFGAGALLLAPTGRAAARIRDTSGLPASTIHSWLYRPLVDSNDHLVGFDRRDPEDLAERTGGASSIVVDESSMIHKDVFEDLCAASAQLELPMIFVGDSFQLPPVVGKKEDPFSIFDTGAVARAVGDRFKGRVDLTEVMRQALDSPVLRAATALRQGGWRNLHASVAELPRLRVPSLSQRLAEQRLALGTKLETATAPIIIAHKNVTRLVLNTRVHASLGYPSDDLAAGEPLLIRRNQRKIGLANGELVAFEGWAGQPFRGRGTQQTLRPTEFSKLALGDDGSILAIVVGATLAPDYVRGEIDIDPGYAGRDCVGVSPYLHAQLGYAITCHSAQGSEWPTVTVVIEKSLRVMSEEDRVRWVYTAVTRSRDVCEIAFI